MKNIVKSILIASFFVPTLFSQSADSIKLAKKNERIQKRYIHPKSKYISVSAGWNFASTYTNDPNNFLKQGLVMGNNSYFPSVIYEHGIKNNFFGEVGYDYTKLGIRMSRDMGNGKAWSRYWRYHPKHSNHNLKIGGGYRVIGKNNFHFLNVHGGFFFSFSNKSNEHIYPIVNQTATYSISEPSTNLNYQIEHTLESYSRFSFGPYIGISKEIRLSEDVRFFVKYIHRFGLNSHFSGTYVFSDNLNFDQDATYNVRGGGAFISGGLKILLFKKKLNNNEE